MATKEMVNKALASGGGQMVQADRIETLLERIDIKRRFDEVLGDKSAGFISSVISASRSKGLSVCPPMSVVASAMVAATLDLSINPELGHAHIVPYRENGTPVAQFQMGWKGYVQLGQRTNLYRTMNASEIYEDEIEFWNPITGELKLRPMSEWKQRYSKGARDDGKIAGYSAYFRLLNGFEKFLYMTNVQLEDHAKRYSKSYQRGLGNWVTDPHGMKIKTPLKLLLKKFGPMSVQIQKALQADHAVVDLDGQVKQYPDAVDAPGEIVNDAIEPTEGTVEQMAR